MWGQQAAAAPQAFPVQGSFARGMGLSNLAFKPTAAPGPAEQLACASWDNCVYTYNVRTDAAGRCSAASSCRCPPQRPGLWRVGSWPRSGARGCVSVRYQVVEWWLGASEGLGQLGHKNECSLAPRAHGSEIEGKMQRPTLSNLKVKHNDNVV